MNLARLLKRVGGEVRISKIDITDYERDVSKRFVGQVKTRLCNLHRSSIIDTINVENSVIEELRIQNGMEVLVYKGKKDFYVTQVIDPRTQKVIYHRNLYFRS